MNKKMIAMIFDMYTLKLRTILESMHNNTAYVMSQFVLIIPYILMVSIYIHEGLK